MRAAVFKKPGLPLMIENRSDPVPLAGEVVIKVGRCGICGSDIHLTSGHGPTYPLASVIGHEFAGEIIAIGKDVANLHLNSLITAVPVVGCGRCAACIAGYAIGCRDLRNMGEGFAEYMRVAAQSAVKLPSSMSLADGALVEPLAVGLRGVTHAQMTPGTKVLVLGAGVVGLSVIFWARQMAAGSIVAASPSARRGRMAELFGADRFEVLGDDDATRIETYLGQAPDVVFECAGTVGALQKSVDLVRAGGTIISLGFCGRPDSIVPMAAAYKSLTVKFVLGYNLREFESSADVLSRGAIEPRLMVTRTISLDELPSVFEAIRHGNSDTKVQVDPWKHIG